MRPKTSYFIESSFVGLRGRGYVMGKCDSVKPGR